MGMNRRELIRGAAATAAFTALSQTAFALDRGMPTPPDPFYLNDSAADPLYPPYRATSAYTLRSQAFNPAQKTLILIGAGQSQATNINPTLFTPTTSSAIDQFNIYDGACYNISGPLLGTQYNGGLGGSGPGNPIVRVANLFQTNGIFDRVIVIGCAIGGTTADQWATGPLSDRIPVIMRRLISRGFVPGSTGLTFAITWWQGENPSASQSAYQTAIGTILSNAQNAGFNGRMFVNLETWVAGATNSTTRAAQAAVVNGTTIFQGGDLDTLNASNRIADNTHLNDTGAAAAALLVYNAMHASGSPY